MENCYVDNNFEFYQVNQLWLLFNFSFALDAITLYKATWNAQQELGLQNDAVVVIIMTLMHHNNKLNKSYCGKEEEEAHIVFYADTLSAVSALILLRGIAHNLNASVTL